MNRNETPNNLSVTHGSIGYPFVCVVCEAEGEWCAECESVGMEIQYSFAVEQLYYTRQAEEARFPESPIYL